MEGSKGGISPSILTRLGFGFSGSASSQPPRSEPERLAKSRKPKV
jgi:hypothetical protein